MLYSARNLGSADQPGKNEEDHSLLIPPTSTAIDAGGLEAESLPVCSLLGGPSCPTQTTNTYLWNENENACGLITEANGSCLMADSYKLVLIELFLVQRTETQGSQLKDEGTAEQVTEGRASGPQRHGPVFRK